MKLTILVSSAGRRGALLECFREDAKRLGIQLRIVAADLRPERSAACQLADASHAVPRCTDEAFVPALMQICRKERAAILVPTIDTELTVLSRSREDFATAGTRVVVSGQAVIDAARDKEATAAILARAGITTPRTVSSREYNLKPSELRSPVIAKPVGGSSSVGIIRARSGEDLRELPSAGYIVQELWEGTEYTVNVFFDQSGRLRCAIPHERIETRGGEVSKGITRHVRALEDAAQKLATALPGVTGPLCFQAIVTSSGEYAVFEINARFGGGYPLAHRAGARFSQWLLEEAAGLPLSANNDWKEGVTMLRYDSAVFLNG